MSAEQEESADGLAVLDLLLLSNHDQNTSTTDHDDMKRPPDNVDKALQSAKTVAAIPRYNSRKPTWWLRLSGKPTKAQKRALNELEEYRITKPAYGTFLDWSSVFPVRTEQRQQSTWYEIGCGNGDNLLALAHLYPDRCHVGAEVHAAGAGALLQHIRQGLDGNPWTGYNLYGSPNTKCHPSAISKVVQLEGIDGMAYAPNIRTFVGDGIGLLDRIPSSSLDAILTTFPDPFPRAGEENLRVFQVHTLQTMHERLRPGGRLFLATDHPVFYAWAHEMVDRVNQSDLLFRRIEPCPDRRLWLPVVSKYEQKGLDERRTTLLSCWEKAAQG